MHMGTGNFQQVARRRHMVCSQTQQLDKNIKSEVKYHDRKNKHQLL